VGVVQAVKGALWVAERDIRKFIRQPFVIGAVLIAPFIMLVLLGYAFGGTIQGVPVAVVKESDGPTSNRILDSIASDKTFQVTMMPDLDGARTILERGRVRAIVYIPRGFDETLANRNNAYVELHLDNTDPASTSAIRGRMRQIVLESSSTPIEVRPILSGIFLDEANYYRKVEYIEFIAPGSVVQAIFIASIIGGGVSILLDKQRGVLEGYLVTPLEQHEIVIGVLLAGVVKALVSAGGMLTLAILLAGVRPNLSPEWFVLTSATVVLTGLGVISMMTALAVRAPVPEVYQFSSFPINLILYFTSGAIYPVEGFPWWMKYIATVNPEAYAVHALRQIMYKTADIGAIATDLGFLAVFTTVMVIIATLVFKRSL
jgi:ABC-2 type transport system permease protein